MAVDVRSAAQRQAREFAERSLSRLREHLTKLAAEQVVPIVIGGWAVAAHGSPLGSRDVDGLIRMKDQRRVGDALGNPDFVAAHLEGDSAFDYDFLETTNRSRVGFPVAFAYKGVLDGQTQKKRVKAGLVSLTLTVPDPTALFFLKAKAFADRSFAFHALSDPAKFKRLAEEPQEYIRAKEPEEWARKAAKDMDDLAFLSGLEMDTRRLAQLLDDSGLRKYAIREWVRRDPDLLAIADLIREDHGQESGVVAARFGRVLDLLSS